MIGEGEENFNIRLPHKKGSTPKVKQTPVQKSRTPTPIPVPKESKWTKKNIIIAGVCALMFIGAVGIGVYLFAKNKAAKLCDQSTSRFINGECVEHDLVDEYKLALKASKYIAFLEGDCYFQRRLPSVSELEERYEGLNATLLLSNEKFNVEIRNGTVHSTKPDYLFLCTIFANDATTGSRFYGFVIVVIVICAVIYYRRRTNVNKIK